MPYCYSCGNEVAAGMRFCPVCGNTLTAPPPAPEPVSKPEPEPVFKPASEFIPKPVFKPAPEPVSKPASPLSGTDPDAPEYRLFLVSCGTCTKTTARELFRDIFGYTITEARDLTDNTPVELAGRLDFRQALRLCQLFSEYGIQVSPYLGSKYVDLSPYATASVFDASGALIREAANVIASVSAASRVNDFLHGTLPNTALYIFAPHYYYTRPPVYQTRTVRPTSSRPDLGRIR